MILAHGLRPSSMGAFNVTEFPSTKVFATHGSTVRSLSYDLRHKPVSLEEASLGSKLAIHVLI